MNYPFHRPVSLLAFRKGYHIPSGFIQFEVNFGESSWFAVHVFWNKPFIVKNVNWTSCSIHICSVVYENCRDSEAQYEMVNEKRNKSNHCYYYSPLWLRQYVKHSKYLCILFTCFWKQIESKSNLLPKFFLKFLYDVYSNRNV